MIRRQEGHLREGAMKLGLNCSVFPQEQRNDSQLFPRRW